MLNREYQYHAIIKKVIIAFGRVFSDIKITREDEKGVVQQTIVVPIAYAPKEKWIVRLEQDPNLDKHTYTTLPRLSFEITGYAYDSARKVNKMSKINCYKDSKSSSVLSPVPYNIDISMYVLTKNQEDAMQILEQILPVFNPEYNLSIIAVPELNIIQDVPLVLNNVTVSDEYEGDFQTRRFVNHTLNFTIKTNIFGPAVNQNVILDSNVNINTTKLPPDNQLSFRATAEVVGGEISEDWTRDL